MDKILALCDQKDTAALNKQLGTLSEKELCSCFDKCARKQPENLPKLMCAILRGLPSSESGCSTHKQAVYLCGVKLLQKGDLATSLASKLFCILLENCTFSPESSVNVSSYFIDSIKSGQYGPGKWLELFPQILSDVLPQTKLPYVEGHVTGVEYKSHVVNTICSGRWPPNLVVSLATMFTDLALSSDELKFVLEKILRILPDMEYDSMPPLVYQLLLLANKGHRKFVLDSLVSFFNQEEAKVKSLQKPSEQESELEVNGESCKREDLRQCEGTVLLHVLYAARSDSDLGNELVKLLKANRRMPEKILSPFMLALSLCVSSIQQFKTPIFDCLKAAITHYYKEKLLKENSFWAREVLGDDDNIDDIIMMTISISASGWDHVAEGLVEFGFLLLDAFGGGKLVSKGGKDNATPAGMASSLGSTIILNVFKENRNVRRTIFEEVLLHIVPTNTSLTTHYLTLLNKTIQQSPQAYLESIQKVRDLLDLLIHLPTSMAIDSLNALQPLLLANSSLRDSLLLILRKAMFSRQLDCRKTAVSGFLSCLKNFRIMGVLRNSPGSPGSSTSQFSADVHVPMKPSANEALCLELLGLLRRAFTQQSDVRVILYNGLPGVISASPYLTDTVLDLLLTQAHTYVEPGSVPPLKLQQTVQLQGSQTVILEPLPHLLRCIKKCTEIAKSQHAAPESETEDLYEEKEAWIHPLMVLLQELTDAMIKTELEDFELDKAADYNTSTSVGSKNFLLASLVLGVYEALMEYSFFHYGYSTIMVDKVLQLFLGHHKLVSVIKEKSTGTKNAKKGPNSNKATVSKKKMVNVLSSSFITAIMKSLILDNIPEHQEALAEMREHAGFQQYIVSMAVQSVTYIQENGSFETEVSTNEELFQYCCAIGRVFFHCCTTEDYGPNRQRNSDIAFAQKCLEGLASTVAAVFERFPDKLPVFLDSLIGKKSQCDASKPSEINDATLHVVLKKIQHLLIKALSPTDKSVKYKDVGPLLNVFSALTNHLLSTSQQFKDVSECIQQVCAENTIDELITVKSLLSLLLKLNLQTSTFLQVLKKLAEDCHKQLGDAEDDDDKSSIQGTGGHYSLVSGITATTVVSLILQHSEKFLANVEMVLTRLKAKLSSDDGSANSVNARIAKEKSISSCLALLAMCLHELVVSIVPLGAITDSVIRIMTKQYFVLSEFTKYYLLITGSPNCKMCSRFEKLVRLTNTHLTPEVYSFFNHIQQAAQNDKGKGKDKVKKMPGLEVSKALRETRSVPQLIFNIEQYERYIIQLSKKSKVNLTANLKLSTNRDFRIDMTSVQEALATQPEELSEGDTEQNENVNPGSENSRGVEEEEAEEEAVNPSSKDSHPPRKKRKLASSRLGKIKKK